MRSAPTVRKKRMRSFRAGSASKLSVGSGLGSPTLDLSLMTASRSVV